MGLKTSIKGFAHHFYVLIEDLAAQIEQMSVSIIEVLLGKQHVIQIKTRHI